MKKITRDFIVKMLDELMDSEYVQILRMKAQIKELERNMDKFHCIRKRVVETKK